MESDYASIRELDLAECMTHLETEEVGRLAVNDWNTPIIFPVNYRVRDGMIVFRTDPGTKQTRGPWASASFEVDHIDPDRREGWSVLVVGRLEEVTGGARHALAEELAADLRPWGGGAKDHWMRLTPTRITGRRVQPDGA